MKVSADFLQQVRDECYNKSLKCLEATDFIGEHQEIPIINFCKANDISPNDLSFEQQAKKFYNKILTRCAATACWIYPSIPHHSTRKTSTASPSPPLAA